jgi:glc operon protein GlcG
MMKLSTYSLTAAALLTLGATPAWSQDTKPVLTLAVAKKMGDGCEAKAKAQGWKMVIAVIDDGGNLKYFSRMEDSFLISVQVATMKGQTSARVPASTRQFGELSKSLKGLDLVPGTISFAGGLPIMMGKKHIGGLGVSGGTADQDEMCAQAGLDAVKEMLK